VPDAPRTPPQCPPAARAHRAADTLVWTAARVQVLPRRRHRMRRLASTAVAGRAAWTVGRRRPPYPLPCSGAAAVSAAESGRPASTWPQSRTCSGHCRGVRCRGHGLGFRVRSAQPADIGGPNLRPRTRPADTGSPQAAGTVDTRDCGMGTRTLRQRPAGQPAAEPSTAACMSGRERDPKVRHRPAPPWPDRQIRRLVLCVDLVGSRRICRAHVGCLVDRDGSRRVPSDRLDDQRDD
jgi:hypothetical protein